MGIARPASASIAAIALAATLGSVSLSGQSATLNGVAAVPKATAESASATDQSATLNGVTAVPKASGFAEFATLQGVKAVPMSSGELDAVKGLHIHFFVNGVLHLIGEPPPASKPNGSVPGDPAPGYNGIAFHACGNGTISIIGGPQTCG